MKNNTDTNKSFDDMTIRESLLYDVSNTLLRNTLIIDPAPIPVFPLTPIVIGKKIVKGTKNAFNAIKKLL